MAGICPSQNRTDALQDLFPDAFDIAFPFPSLNVRDLYTVDVGVREKIDDILSGNHSLVLFHELGVDHCGHR